jgi:hypothetical protein
LQADFSVDSSSNVTGSLTLGWPLEELIVQAE